MINTLADVMIEHGIPEHVRSTNGPEFVAKDLREWLTQTGADRVHRTRISVGEGTCESFNGNPRDEFLKAGNLKLAG